MTEIRPPAMTATAQMHVPNIGVRQSFAMEHLWNARHMADLCAERETALVQGGFRGIDRAVRSFALSAILESVGFLEAFVSGVWQDAADTDPPSSSPRLAGLPDLAVARLKELWDNGVDRSPTVLHKYQLALLCADRPKMSTGDDLGQTVDALILVRNEFVHFKPKVQWSQEVGRLEVRLRSRLGESPLLDTSWWFPHHVLTANAARVAFDSCRAFAERWWSQMGFTWDPFDEFKSLNPQMPT